MNSKKFTPIQLTYCNDSLKNYETELATKTKYINDLKELLSNYIFKIEDLNIFKEQPTAVLDNLITENYKNDFPPYVSNLKIAEFVGINLHSFNAVFEALQSIQVEIDYNTLEAIKPDFGVYTTNESQNQAYRLISMALEGVMKLNSKLKVHVFPLDLIKSLNNTCRFNFATNKIEVSTQFILDIKE
jgi:hypothetical protein